MRIWAKSVCFISYSPRRSIPLRLNKPGYETVKLFRTNPNYKMPEKEIVELRQILEIY